MTSGTGRRIGVALIVVILVGIGVYVGTSRWKAPIKAPLLDGSTTTVVPGVHLLGGLGPAAAYAIETSDGLILIDAGLESDAQLLKGAMEKLGLNWKKLRAIFLTHTHGDHVGGAERLRAETGARIYAGQGDVPILAAGGPRVAFYSTFKMPNHTPHVTTVDVALQGEETIAVGDVRVQALGTPGHTTGSTCYLIERDGLRVLCAGDIIMRFGEKPLGTYITYLAPRYRGDAQAYLNSLRKLRTIPVPELVLPGHPGSNGGLHSPQMTQAKWNAMLDRGIVEMQRLIARHQADGTSFLDGQAKQLLPDLYYFGDFQGAPVYGLFAASRLFVIDAPGGPGLSDFLNSQLQKLDLKPTPPFAVLLTACGPQETAGLQELIELANPQIFASPDGLQTIKDMCPPGTVIVSADELKAKGLPSVNAIPLAGRGVAPIAYLLRWSDKSILFSGRIPLVMNQDTREGLLTELANSKLNATAYVNSIRRLVNVHPDLWLPAVSVDSQNANLYDYAWPAILEKNYLTAGEILQAP